MRVFVVLKSILICKQFCLLHCFNFVAFVYNFNVKRYQSKTSVSRFFPFLSLMLIVVSLRVRGIRKHTVDVVGALPVTISRHLSALVYFYV